MEDSTSQHLAKPENTNIEMRKLDTDTPGSDRVSNKESKTKPSKQRVAKNSDNRTPVHERVKSDLEESNTLLNADHAATPVVPTSAFSSRVWGGLPPTDPSLPPSSSNPPPVHQNSTAIPAKTFKGRRRTLRLSQRQKDAVNRHAKSVSKSFVVFLVSHVGLTCLVVAYSIMGGFIFQALEASNEVRGIARIQEIRRHHVSKLWNVTDELNIFEPSLWRAKANQVLTNFQLEIYEAVKDKDWDGTDNVTNKDLHWNFAGSLLYSVTVITTIGYGHLTPKTMWGRVVTMVYALVGIPMTLLCLANIGSFMARCFRILWNQIVCQPLRNRIKRRSMLQAAKKKASAAVYIAGMASRKRVDGDPGVEAGYVGMGARAAGRDDVTGSCSDSPATVHDGTTLLRGTQAGNASSLPLTSRDGQRRLGFEGLGTDESSWGPRHQPWMQDSLSRPAASAGRWIEGYHDSPRHLSDPQVAYDTTTKDQSEFATVPGPVNKFGGGEGPIPENQTPAVPMAAATTTTATITTTAATTTVPGEPDLQLNVLDLEVKQASKPEVVRVPIMVCLVMVAAYIVLGAVLFSLWEKWNYFDSSYFCFITLSTIGFGDMVPGYEHNNWDNQAKRVSCTLYLLFGLALVAMCFDLIQTECREIFNDIARALGFAEEDAQ